MEKKQKLILIIVFIIAILTRLIFIINTTVTEYQYDAGIKTLNSIEDYDDLYLNYHEEPMVGRHIDYIMYLFNYNSLPETVIGEYYQPPLNHIVLALWLKLVHCFTSNTRIFFESMQWIPFLYSIAILFVIKKILDELEVKNQILPMLLVSCYPLLIFMSGMINNDELVTLFILITLLYLLRWRKDQSIKNATIGALAIGLGLMTKTSMLVMYLPAIYIYFKTIFTDKDIDNEKIKKLVIEVFLICIISVFLGFWFQFYRHGETLGIIEPKEELNISQYSYLERFGLVSPFDISKVNINIWISLMENSIGFFVIENTIIRFFFEIFACFIWICWFYYFIKNKKDGILITTYVAFWIGYFYLNIVMPYSCSMSARYMVVPLIIKILEIGRGFDKENNQLIKIIGYILSVLFFILSIYYIIVLSIS